MILIDELRCLNVFLQNKVKTSVSQKIVFCLAMKLFCMNGKVNRQNVRYLLQQNLYFVDYFKQQGAPKVICTNQQPPQRGGVVS